MTVLVVDDQISVVSAITSGIAWHEIGITKVLKAHNAFEAKEKIQSQKIDVMLCDIEMPGEDGLQLFRWVKFHKYDLECIFLTSHADFYYAKEALQLGGADYILQPARYEDVQAALRKAIKKVIEHRELETYSSYGRTLEDLNEVLLDNLIGTWLHAEVASETKLEKNLRQLRTGLNVSDQFYFALLEILNNDTTHTNNYEELRYGLTNIIREISSEYGQSVMVVKYDKNTYAILLFSESIKPLEPVVFTGFLNSVIQVCDQNYHTRIAAYAGDFISFLDLPQTMCIIKDIRKNNLIRAARVFERDEKINTDDFGLKELDYQRWEILARQGNFSTIKMEICSWIDLMEQKDCLSYGELQDFYYRFIQLVFWTTSALNINIQDLLPDSKERDKLLNPSIFNSIWELRDVIELLAQAFDNIQEMQQGEGDIIESIVHYIHDNIERDIRRADIAVMLHLSQDYISHLFSRRMNMSLIEFIINEKMNLARSLLSTTNLPIWVVASKVGYTNFSHFSKMYKKVFGISPTGEKKKNTK